MNFRKTFLEPLYFKKVNFNKYTLKNIINFSVRNVEYYKKFYGLSLHDFPILTKEIIKRNFYNLRSDDIYNRKAYKNSSGGSTGKPLTFLQDIEYLYAQRQITYEQKSWTGYNFGDPLIKLWGDENEILKNKKSHKLILLNFFKNIKFLNAFNITNDKMYDYIQYINRYEPSLLVAYVESIYQIAKFAKDNDVYIKPINSIMCTAGTLYPNIKSTIERVFNTKVYNRYGSREVGNIACTKFHYQNELKVTKAVYLEVVDKNGKILSDGEEGELLVTSLVNYSMPLIRYKIGDRGILKNENGRQTLIKITGRSSDIFKTKKGSIIHGEYFSHLFYFMNWVLKYQVIQKRFDLILVKIATKDRPVSKDIKKIELGIKKVMGAECKVDINISDDLPHLNSGKFRYLICEL